MIAVWEFECLLNSLPGALKTMGVGIMDTNSGQKFKIRFDVSQFEVQNGTIYILVEPQEPKS